MLCYGSETDKTSPVQQYPILDVVKYLFDGKNLHIEIEDGGSPKVLDLQASSKSEAKAILVKITDSRKVAQVAGTQVSHKILAGASGTASPRPPPPPQQATPSPLVAALATTTSSRIATPPATTMTTTTTTTNEPRWAISLYEFTAEGGEEISIAENQQILVTDYDRDDGWWRVETIDGKSGILPTSYIEFHEDDNNHSNSAVAPPTIVADDVDHEAHDEVEAYMRTKEQRDREEQAEMQRHIDRTEQLEQERRRQAEAAAAADEAERKAEQQRRDEEERERRRKVQEAHQRQEVARQRQMEEERKRRESVVVSLIHLFSLHTYIYIC